jgi:hypothetical protein
MFCYYLHTSVVTNCTRITDATLFKPTSTFQYSSLNISGIKFFKYKFLAVIYYLFYVITLYFVLCVK